MGSSQYISFKGETHQVIDKGEVTAIRLLTPINPPSDDPIAIKPGDIIYLSNLESYNFSTI